jgi:hypothetical protein
MSYLARYAVTIALALVALALLACSSDNGAAAPSTTEPAAPDSPTSSAAAPTPTATLPADSPTSGDDVLQARVGEEFRLAVGQAASLEPGPVSIEFLGVVEDSRCPEDVQCIQAGRAVVSLRIDGDEVRLTVAAPNVANAGGYALETTALDPYPVSTDDPEERDYVATLVVRESATGLGEMGPVDGSSAAFRCCAPGFKWAPIESVRIDIAESFPPQYFLTVVSGLPNGCVKFDNYYPRRIDETNLEVQIINSVPTEPGTECTLDYGTVETTVVLGSKFESGRTYTLTVNDTIETFVAQ